MQAHYKRIAKIAVLFVLAGAVISPLDISIQRDRKQLRFGGRGMSLKLREQMGQGLAIAFLGGFRGLTADLLWIKLHHEWEEGSDPQNKDRWARIPPLAEAVVALQPQYPLFYDLIGWHYAYNFYHRFLYDPAEPDARVRQHNARQWMLRGEATLLEGTRNIPYDATLFAALARLYEDRGKFNDPERAAQYWELCLDKENAPSYAHRMVGHSLQRAAFQKGEPQRFRVTFDWWKKIWFEGRNNPSEIWSPVRRGLRTMREMCLHFALLSAEEDTALAKREAELNIPLNERVFTNAPPTSPGEWRERFDVWNMEWLSPRGHNPQVWEFVRSKLVEIRPHITLTEDEEDWFAQVEERLEVPPHDRLYKRKPARQATPPVS
jgi:hypothetical protein